MYQGKFSKKNVSAEQNKIEKQKDPIEHSQISSLNFQNDVPEKNREQEGRKNQNLQFDIHFDESDQDFIPDQELNEVAEMLSQPIVVKKHLVGSIIGGILFYALLIGGILFFWMHLQSKLGLMTNQLADYEKLQPTYTSQNVFAENFTAPDWAAIFDDAGAFISEYEGREAYADSMKLRTGDHALRYKKAADLEHNRIQYDVFSGNDRVASFFMKNESQDPNSPDWKMDGTKVYYTADQVFRIKSYSDHVVKVNGITLDKTLQIQRSGKIFTPDLGEKHEEIQLPSMCLYEISGFLMKPAVTIEDSEGNLLNVSYDEETRTFSEPDRDHEIPEDIQQLALDTVTTYCEFMIKKANRADLFQYFKTGTPTYRAITGSDLTWIQKEKGHSISGERFYDYVKLSDTAFTIRVSLTWQLVRQDDSIKESLVDVGLIFEKDGADRCRCIRMSHTEFLKPFNTVRVRFMHEGNLLSTSQVDSTQSTIYCPLISPGDGTKLVGWVMVMLDEEGKDYYQRVLVPDESGNAAVPDNLFTKPVDLFPVYDKR